MVGWHHLNYFNCFAINRKMHKLFTFSGLFRELHFEVTELLQTSNTFLNSLHVSQHLNPLREQIDLIAVSESVPMTLPSKCIPFSSSHYTNISNIHQMGLRGNSWRFSLTALLLNFPNFCSGCLNGSEVSQFGHQNLCPSMPTLCSFTCKYPFLSLF